VRAEAHRISGERTEERLDELALLRKSLADGTSAIIT
jgi:hypothetical protein